MSQPLLFPLSSFDRVTAIADSQVLAKATRLYTSVRPALRRDARRPNRPTSPASRSEMTATTSAPARSIGQAARREWSMPPIATTGSRPPSPSAATRLTPSSADDRIGRLPWSRSQTPDRSPDSRPARRQPAANCASECVEQPDPRGRPPASARDVAGVRSSCPTCTPSAPARRATSARSLTMNVRAGGRHAPAISSASVQNAPDRQRLGAQLDQPDAGIEPGVEDVERRRARAPASTSISRMA